MRHCDACCREFTGRSPDCPFCGFHNAPYGGPRSARSLSDMEGERQDQEEFEREFSELSDEFAAWLGWAGVPEEPERTPA